MLNKEKFAKEIEDILAKTVAVSKSGEIYLCVDKGNCKDCIFYNGACIGDVRKWLNSEYKEQILDDVEKRYLRGVIRPFKNKVKSILKLSIANEWIVIQMDDDYEINLPKFKKGTMYQGMEGNRRYTLEELGL